MSQRILSPREFLKARRPENFSDSVAEQVPALDRSLLEYHLDTLASRSQETDFERFARRLAQVEICPNLLPHTGPTGGGDSKVDTETYPVADALSLTWHIGTGREAAQERWAFAFSAMKDWRQKLQSDVAKIVGTGRGYTKAFFITNRFVPDRVRAEVEDGLRQKHGLDVRVLDRTWILDIVFAGDREELAIEELKLSISVRTQQRKGPGDVQKESELNEVESRIKEAGEQDRADFALVADCIRAAELARGLELPRSEIEGRLLRAKRVANENGTQHQQLLAAYQWAWTAFWWFEDSNALSEQYTDVENHAVGSRNAYDLELLMNLWSNLQMSVRAGKLTEADAKLTERTRVLITELERVKSDRERSSTALQAEGLRLMMELITTPPDKSDPLLEQFADVITRSEGLLGFPLEPVVQLLTEFGDVLGERPPYQNLHETIVNTVAKRSGEVAAARLLLQRGAQQLDADRSYNAIRSLGQALMRLYKHESRRDLIKALYLCGNAYERIGLKWAARGTLLTAASVAISDFWTYAEVTPEQAACFNRLKWLEVQLGRLPHTLVWHQTAQSVHSVLENAGYNLKRFEFDEVRFDACVAILLLRADLWRLKDLSRLPDTLDHLGLSMSAVALRFALGHEGELPKELGEAAERLNFFTKLQDQPAANDLPDLPQLYNERRVTLKSRLLGCNITLEVDNRSPCVELAESIVAAMEALLSTGIEHRFFAHEPVLTINVRGSEFAKWPFDIDAKDQGGRPHVEISIPDFHAHKLSHDAQHELKEKVVELLVKILARVFVIDVSEQQLRKLFQDELALQRAVDFTSSFVALGNVLGHAPKTNLDSWIDASAREYALKRSEKWDAATRAAKVASAPSQVSRMKRGTGEPPSALEQGNACHAEMETVSLIREPLWNQAKWAGTMFIWDLEHRTPPLLALMFRDAQAGKDIFAHLRAELGQVDKQDRLRISIIRGVMKGNIYGYRVVIGSNPETNIRKGSRLFFMVNRMNTMEPTSDRNLSGFLASYNAVKEFILAPAFLRDDSSEPEPFFESGILKRHLYVRDAWEIGRNDIDACGLRDDDDLVIPAGQEKAPALEVIQWLKQCQQRNSASGGKAI